MSRQKLPNNREAVILAVLINGQKYGREIRNEYEKRTGETMPLGSLYTTLERMAGKAFLTSRMGENTLERGGNRRKYYRLTASGSAALRALDAWSHGIAEAIRYV